ncbi:hypothetical protein BD560DRAFT_418351 [Blakeslea trispora]|nr:hypothetical protein BD560DRAFT_418351 [Blakeslea trispora]
MIVCRAMEPTFRVVSWFVSHVLTVLLSHSVIWYLCRGLSTENEALTFFGLKGKTQKVLRKPSTAITNSTLFQMN